MTTLNQFAALIGEGIHDDHTGDIVDALGGIDKVLLEYIRIAEQYEDEELLNAVQIQQITDIVNTEHVVTFWDRIYSMANLRDDTFHLSRHDSLLHHICGSKNMVERVIYILFSKITMICYAVFAAAIIVPHALSSRGIYFQE